MKENYELLKMDVIAFEAEDVITTSGEETPACTNDCIM